MSYLEFISGMKLPDNVVIKSKEMFDGFAESSLNSIIPKIKSIVIRGLYPYKSDHDIVISHEKANIIYGGNGAGKTTSINSIEFGLLGSLADFEIKSNFSNRVINRFDVQVNLEINGKQYILQSCLCLQPRQVYCGFFLLPHSIDRSSVDHS